MLTRDGWLLFATRSARLFAYGMLSVVLVLYLRQLGLSETEVGLLLTATLLGDVAVSLVISTHADRLGRRRMLIASALLMIAAAGAFAWADSFALLLVAATFGIVSPGGGEVGPFLAIEQAALAQATTDDRRTSALAWYNLAGSVATALGALAGGVLTEWARGAGLHGPAAYHPVLILYGTIGALLVLLFTRLSAASEVVGQGPSTSALSLGLPRSRRVVLRLSALFALDAFGGGFVIQSIIAYWFHVRFGVGLATIGAIFFGANLLAAASALAAGWLARKIGLVNTMVFTHLPSNVLLILVPLAPNLPLAITILLLRFSISQMDVPTRQSYTLAVVHPDERAAAAGVTGVARSVGAALSPSLAAVLVASPAWMAAPFFLAGGIKIAYDLLLYRAFAALRPVEERPR